MDLTTLVAVAAAAALTFAGLWGYGWALARRQRRDRDTLGRAQARDLDLPPTLHPVIDPRRCMGSLACVAACPEGDILGIVDGRAQLLEGSRCIGHGKCAAACPTGAISLVFGTARRGVDLPEVGPTFETNRPGVYIVGELAGMGLIRNAVTQGVEVATTLRRDLADGAAVEPEDTCDVAIVGAGPAGIATAAACRAEGLSLRLLEQDTLGGAVAHYPRQKVVMSEPVEIPGYGRFGRSRLGKEDLLALLRDVLAHAGLEVEEGVGVTGIDGAAGAFVLQTGRGPVRARRVVLALGRRGTPRKLEVPGEEGTNVTYRLVDPEQYRGRRVLVVGGGDAAIESATALAAAGAEVGISYRGRAFGRCRPENLAAISAAVRGGQVRAFLGSTVRRIAPGAVELDVEPGIERALELDAEAAGAGETGGAPPGRGVVTVPSDFVLVNAGGVLPKDFLTHAGIDIERHHGDQPARGVVVRRASRHGGRVALALGTAALLIVAALTAYGWEYYRLPLAARRVSELHPRLRPAGTWGHGLGVAATGAMLLTFLYAARKRLRPLAGLGHLGTWLNLHVLVGLTAPAAIALHTALQSNNLLASITAGSLAIVVATGIVGRWLFAQIPTADGRLMPRHEVDARLDALSATLHEVERHGRDAARLHRLAGPEGMPHASRSMAALLLRLPIEPLLARWRARAARPCFAAAGDYQEFRAAYLEVRRMSFQLGFYGGLRRLMTVWRAFHVVLAVVLLLFIAAHVGISVYLGYRWVF